ncbi:uracil-DNA glycosylase [Desulfosarcina sp.]|uniref:uracil-DNA glycosylase n=1 Tax=Desulfosarcina sp. TaxID=2027861 RepID=UPI0029A0DC58|nr:uracil-DNA glycosylase [Desulfosarcina sp.]MDX2490317.1 uracil-DNA glycosylase [Desulfosarcina sp.]
MCTQNINAEIQRCTRCRLSKTRIHALCGEGNVSAKLMLIAQAPGENEDRIGKMFIGPSGKVLDELLEIAHIDRNNIYMTNLVKCMLPKYRRPKSDEINMCSRYLDREIELISPEILAPLGYFATRYILKKYDIPIPSKPEFRKLYGKVVEADNKKILPLQHPAAVLHDGSIKEVLVRNYQKLRLIAGPRPLGPRK